MTDFLVTHTWVKCRVLSELLSIKRRHTEFRSHHLSPVIILAADFAGNVRKGKATLTD